MMFLAKLGVGFLGTVLIGGAALSSEGFIHVRVNEKEPGGTHVNLIVPALAVPLALRFVPCNHFASAPQDLRQYLPVIDAAVPALEDAPDGVLVEVQDHDDHVVVAKRGWSIVVDVNDPNDDVHVSVPLSAAQSALHEIAASNPI